jgi:chitin disaccharide deacetylase
MKRLIVTADDYGMCTSVNDAIEDCLSAGTVTSTCVMVNMDAYQPAATLKQRFPRASLGLHWTLSQGKPVSAPATVRSLISGDGQFVSIGACHKRWRQRSIQPEELRRELIAQYEKYCETVGRPEYWNTHENAHVCPGLYQFFVRLSRELKIPATRCYRRTVFPNSYNLKHPVFWLKGHIHGLMASWAKRRGLKMPDRRICFADPRAALPRFAEALAAIPWKRPTDILEFIIHPACRLEAGLFGNLTQSRLVEYEVFRRPALFAELERAGVAIVSFAAL